MREVNISSYTKFDARERINLTVSAMARGDFAEADRLYATCPRDAYTVNDLEYNCRLMGLPVLQLAFLRICTHLYNMLIKIDHSILNIEIWENCDREQGLYDLMHSRRDEYLSLLIALYKGFSEFCDIVGLNNEEMLDIIDVNYSCPDIGKYLSDKHVADANYTEFVKNEFLECWPFD